MASVTVQKWTTAAACGGQVAHVYRTREHYGNEDIDPAQAAANLFVRDAAESRAAIRETIAAIDSAIPPKRIRADRKTVAELCIPAPRDGMSRDDAVQFLSAAYKEMATACDDMVIVGAAIHGDEVHSYVDPDSKERRESRLHMHVLVVPNVPERGCNMKLWLTRNKYRELNRVLDRVCERELGYSYQDGSGQKSRGNVERMKQRSLQAETDKIRQEVAQLDTVRQKARQDAARAAQEADKAVERATAAERAQKQSEALTEAAERRADELREEIDRLDVVRELSAVPENTTLRDAKATARKSLIGDNVTLPRREFESICSLAETCWTNHAAVLQMQREKSDAERTAQWAEEQAERRARQISLDEAREHAKRDARLGRYERMEKEFPQVFREMDNRLDRMDRGNRNRNIGYDR